MQNKFYNSTKYKYLGLEAFCVRCCLVHNNCISLGYLSETIREASSPNVWWSHEQIINHNLTQLFLVSDHKPKSLVTTVSFFFNNVLYFIILLFFMTIIIFENVSNINYKSNKCSGRKKHFPLSKCTIRVKPSSSSYLFADWRWNDNRCSLFFMKMENFAPFISLDL